MFSPDFISGSRDFTQDLTSGLLILIHSADACVFSKACVDCARACCKKPFPASLNNSRDPARLSGILLSCDTFPRFYWILCE